MGTLGRTWREIDQLKSNDFDELDSMSSVELAHYCGGPGTKKQQRQR